MTIRERRASEVLVAPSGHRSFPMHLKAQQRLRDAGIADPDPSLPTCVRQRPPDSSV